MLWAKVCVFVWASFLDMHMCLCTTNVQAFLTSILEPEHDRIGLFCEASYAQVIKCLIYCHEVNKQAHTSREDKMPCEEMFK